MALLEALQSSWIKISTAVPQLVIETLPAIATSCCCRPSSGSCTIPFCSAQSLALPFSPHLPLNWVLSSGRAVSIHASSLCSSAAAFSIELESREQGVGLPGQHEVAPNDAVSVGHVGLLLLSCPLDVGLAAS